MSKVAIAIPFWRIELTVDDCCCQIEKITDFWARIEKGGKPFWRRLDSYREELNWQIIDKDGHVVPDTNPDPPVRIAVG